MRPTRVDRARTLRRRAEGLLLLAAFVSPLSAELSRRPDPNRALVPRDHAGVIAEGAQPARISVLLASSSASVSTRWRIVRLASRNGVRERVVSRTAVGLRA